MEIADFGLWDAANPRKQHHRYVPGGEPPGYDMAPHQWGFAAGCVLKSLVDQALSRSPGTLSPGEPMRYGKRVYRGTVLGNPRRV